VGRLNHWAESGMAVSASSKDGFMAGSYQMCNAIGRSTIEKERGD